MMMNVSSAALNASIQQANGSWQLPAVRDSFLARIQVEELRFFMPGRAVGLCS